VAGGLLAGSAVLSAVRTFVLPRAEPVRLGRFVFLAARPVFTGAARLARSETERDRVLALYAPIAVLLLPVAWLSVLGAGFALVYGGLAFDGWRHAVDLSGSSLFTLGFAEHSGLGQATAVFAEAMTGIATLALLITYLPAIYAAFARREAVVALIDVRAGPPPDQGHGPPSGELLLWRYNALGWLDHLDNLWDQWEEWFLQIEESHSSLAPLVFFRSAHPWRSWVTTAGTILDAAALRISIIEGARQPRAEFLIRAGSLTLRRLCDFYQLPYPHDPSPTDPISVTRAEFDAVCEKLFSSGVRVRTNRDLAWRAFAGWRVNYDVPLRALCGLTMAPPAPWSGDRAIPFRRPPITIRGRRRRAAKAHMAV
jgi:hypothetical protein